MGRTLTVIVVAIINIPSLAFTAVHMSLLGQLAHLFQLHSTALELLSLTVVVATGLLFNPSTLLRSRPSWRSFLLLGSGLALSLGLGVHYSLRSSSAIAEGVRFRIASLLFTCGSLVLYYIFVLWLRLLGWYLSRQDPSRILIIGSGRLAVVAWKNLRDSHAGSNIIAGFADYRPTHEMPFEVASLAVASIDTLEDYLLRNAVDKVVIAMPMKSCYEQAQTAVRIAESAGMEVLISSELFDNSALRPPSTAFAGPESVLSISDMRWDIMIKRLTDIVGAFVGLILLTPAIAIIAVAVRLTSPGPAFFAQQRCGYKRRLFTIYKFRSMVVNAPELMESLEHLNELDGPVFKIAADPRVTALGRFLRATSLDEVPQLWNVLRGDMSLVGPRPMSIRDVSLFTDLQFMRRFSAKPGMTGSWQVSVRSSGGFDQWILHDFHYLDNWSLRLDFQILLRTIPAVLKRSGAM